MGGLRPINMRCYLKYLEAFGLTHIRTKASHHHYTKRGLLRPIVIQGAEKEVPGFHVSTNAKTLGHSLATAYNWFDENC
jgi:predicted RNA binding protein YcfA (HicA-like mRNA interferase family)